MVRVAAWCGLDKATYNEEWTMSEQEGDLVIGPGGAEGGKDGSAGYLNAEEREESKKRTPTSRRTPP